MVVTGGLLGRSGLSWGVSGLSWGSQWQTSRGVAWGFSTRDHEDCLGSFGVPPQRAQDDSLNSELSQSSVVQIFQGDRGLCVRRLLGFESRLVVVACKDWRFQFERPLAFIVIPEVHGAEGA